MTERHGALYPLSERLAEQLRTARYGIYEPEVDSELAVFDDLAAVAAHLLSVRGKRGLRLEDVDLVWGGEPSEARPAIRVEFTLHDKSVDTVLNVVAWSERRHELWSAIAAAKLARAAA